MQLNTRREFLGQTAGLIGGAFLGLPAQAAQNRRERLPVAAVVTEYRRNSHADVILGKILEGYDQDGGPGSRSAARVAVHRSSSPKAT